jgi:hypothetical protein
MNWFNINLEKGSGDYTFAGSSPLSLEEMAEHAAQGKLIRIDNLCYQHGEQVRD